MESHDLDEPMLQDSLSRLMLFPIQHPDIWEYYKTAEASFWTSGELDLSTNVGQWKKLTEEERHLFSMILAFFASSDAIVNENLLERFCTEVKIPEARSFYTFQAMMENIHGEVYALLIDTLIPDTAEKHRLFRAIVTVDCVRMKADWALRWITSDAAFAQRLVAFAVVEGIFFSGSFAAIFWLKTRDLLPGLTLSNEFISRDEGLHTDFACHLYKQLKNRLEDSTVLNIILGACEVEFSFWRYALPNALPGMNADLMIQYVMFIADHLLISLDIPAHFKVSNPFVFMELISLQGKSNFFERRVSEYSRRRVDNVSDMILTNDDF